MDSSTFSKGDILLVDDTPDNLRLLSTMLTEQEYEVRSVRSGSAALMGVQGQPPDLILLDINMPGMSGYEVCERLKENPDTRGIPVIFISALNEVFDKVKAFAVGGVDYISKPFQVEEVLVRVENQLALRRLQVQLQERNQQLEAAEAELRRALEQERALNQRIEELATLEERNRIARDIHDSLGHALVALNIQMETALALWKDNPEQAYEFLVEAKQLGSHALQATRQSVSDMRSDPLQGRLLEDAIATLLQEFQRTTGVQPECQIQLSRPLSHQLSTVIYRIVQEGLTNICKHAQATAVQLQLRSQDSGLSLILQDNGSGFQVEANRSGFGLQGMRERVLALGGELTITSDRGAGCQIAATFPSPDKH
ncbi:ATP-binding response regulator [Leptodesmis sichuanensis]|uniref:ATP-binding response regulator n=1 Tax=Leptodesmis sichuanensis TaxID=2906798 RepID=UPI001F2DA0BE|nr:response regulator [Leptodesmis sichuanensis]UIE37669.1 response regulator [Leptodesmis sichuanensis A121]